MTLDAHCLNGGGDGIWWSRMPYGLRSIDYSHRAVTRDLCHNWSTSAVIQHSLMHPDHAALMHTG